LNTNKGEKLQISGVKQNNLKNFSLEFEHDQFIAITGVSGSGKSTLAFDTLYAEGGRRYIETFSPYTRQFLDRLPRPTLDSISGVRPALALEQANRIVNSRSTVGTVTEINEYLKIVWAALAVADCPQCGELITRDTPSSCFEALLKKIQKLSPKYIAISFPVEFTGLASEDSFAQTMISQGFVRYFDTEKSSIELLEGLGEDSNLASRTDIVLDRIVIQESEKLDLSSETGKRLINSISQAFALGRGQLAALIPKGKKHEKCSFRNDLLCSSCDFSFPPPSSSTFSFNSPLGACESCNGFGYVLDIDIDRCIPDKSKSIDEGAIVCWETKATRREKRKLLELCGKENISTSKPWKSLSQKTYNLIVEGTKGFRGLRKWFEHLKRKQYKMHVRVFLARYRGQFVCPDCSGTRLKQKAGLYKVKEQTIPEIWKMPISRSYQLFNELAEENRDNNAVEHALGEIVSRLGYLEEIGLGYLTLDRQSRSLSGGESQRVNLTSILGAQLVKTLLVLDEPTIGLHASDTNRLIEIIRKLQQKGNSLLVVEHDQEVIKAADQVIDIGPLSGGQGGEIVYQGSVKGLLNSKKSLTSHYLREPDSSAQCKKLVGKPSKLVKVDGANANNLQNLKVKIPLEGLTVVCGVSGSGKTTLVEKCLNETFKLTKLGAETDSSNFPKLTGLEQVEDIILIDQSPVGKTPRSNPGTYTKAWDLIRECLAETDQAKALGLGKSSFSFNVDGGRCPDCKGAGYHRVEMQFLADVFVLCETCQGSRFQEKVMSITFHNRNVVDFLEMTIEEVKILFEELGEEKRAKEISKRIKPLVDLGLGYLRLGHPLNTLSGGEAQRVKLATHLQETSKGSCLFILDEPTTGLHPHNISSLLKVFDRLTEQGHGVLVIEHNLDVIKTADWIIELGPGGGENGGKLVVEGIPSELLKKKKNIEKSPTLQAIKSERKIAQVRTQAKSKAVRKPSTSIEIHGARHHNLKNVSLNIPLNKLVTISGVSGSGKSSLAFDILFAEGQRRFIDCLSPYARQYMKQLDKAEVDSINLIPPTIAVSQKKATSAGVSTVATTTDIYQYLRLLFCKTGTQHCPEHDLPITSTRPEKIAEEIISLAKGKSAYLFASVVSGRKGYYNDLFQRALQAEISSARIDGKVREISADLRLERHKLHWISLLVGSIKANKKNKKLIVDAIEQCLLLGNGELEVSLENPDKKPLIFNTARVCPKCSRGFRELDPQDFSFRSKRGLCQNCGGVGKVTVRNVEQVCPDCEGARIGPIGRHVYLNNKSIYQLTSLSAEALLKELKGFKYDPRLEPIMEPILTELKHRLKIISQVGLGYLELDRDSSSISGGEAQRLRLAKTLGSPLTGVCYVLDEPTIGLHPEDQELLTGILKDLKKAGNTVVVVEHDEDIIRMADHVIDVGPGGGENGGAIVYQGKPAGLVKSRMSKTGACLREIKKASELPENKTSKTQKYISIEGASANNLRDITARFPLEKLTVVCGVAGAGKSSLVHECLIPAVIDSFEVGKKAKARNHNWKTLKGADSLQKFVEIDQSPLGKTSSSTPASYLGVMKDIRKIYSLLPEAEARGWGEKHFSFNTGAGRCDFCGGKGFIKVPMSFLPDAVTNCEACGGKRYNQETESLLYSGLSIGSLLQKTMDEALVLLKNHKRIYRSLKYICDLGLGYISLGQPSYTLSGGEAQRLKIARELGGREAKDTLYVLDEPTIGLHMSDISRLYSVLNNLVELGNTVLVVEHKVIFSGSPWEIVNNKVNTPTSRALHRYLADD